MSLQMYFLLLLFCSRNLDQLSNVPYSMSSFPLFCATFKWSILYIIVPVILLQLSNDPYCMSSFVLFCATFKWLILYVFVSVTLFYFQMTQNVCHHSRYFTFTSHDLYCMSSFPLFCCNFQMIHTACLHPHYPILFFFQMTRNVCHRPRYLVQFSNNHNCTPSFPLFSVTFK